MRACVEENDLTKSFQTEPIRIQGLKQNNLKNISIDIPKNKIVVCTGVSGSGKFPVESVSV